jgi:hypothetical protein
MSWGLLFIAGIALAAALVAVHRGGSLPATATERVVFFTGAVAIAFLGLLWWYLGRLARAGCEIDCPPDLLQQLAYVTAVALALLTTGPGALKLLVTALTGDLRFASKTWIFALASVVAFAAWFIGWGLAFDATRPGSLLLCAKSRSDAQACLLGARYQY